MDVCNERFGVCAHHVYIAAFVFIVVYGYAVKEVAHKDPLENRFSECEGCDYWGLLHFFLYVALGFLFPSSFVALFLVGVGYELFEVNIGKSSNAISQLGMKSWWYGRGSDIVFNTLGVLVGTALS